MSICIAVPPFRPSGAGGAVIDPAKVLSKREPLMSAVEAFKALDQRRPGWIKVELEPEAEGAEEKLRRGGATAPYLGWRSCPAR